MSGFPGPDNISQTTARAKNLLKTSDVFRHSLEGARAAGTSSFEDVRIERTPDADDFIDALRLRARMVEGGCTRTHRTVHMLNTAADKLRMAEQIIETLQQRLKAREEGSNDVK
jgi:MoxR-like ATPase